MIAHYYRKFIQGIGNLIYYFNVIWSDRQWDYEFFYRIELKKVQKMIRWWSSGDNVTSEKNVLRDLRICEHLLKVLSGEVDHMEVTSTHPINFRFTRYVNLKIWADLYHWDRMYSQKNGINHNGSNRNYTS